MSEKNSISSPSLERAETLNGHGDAYNDKDVFGHEEEHDVRYPALTCQRWCFIFLIFGNSIVFIVDSKLLANSFPLQRLNTRHCHGSSLPPL